jgi:pyrimidine-nucleoside phosphorylase
MDRIVDLVRRKRDAEELMPEEIERLINGYARGEIQDYQMAAFLMAGACNDFTESEAASLTTAMLRCGQPLDLSGIDKPKADTHSTGGVGDKVGIIAAAIAAAAGMAIPVIAEPGIGHVGGTLDKLNSIPSLRTDLSRDEFMSIVAEHGLAFAAQSNELAPADKKLYALRDATATVDSSSLIAASVMSKKMAEGLDALVLDVKVGRGSLVSGKSEARRLAQLMITIGRRMNLRIQALLTDMEQPLGYTVGNALEIMETSQTLQGQGPQDLSGLAVEVSARMIYLAKNDVSLENARSTAQGLLDDGSAFGVLQNVIKAQGGDADALTQFDLLPNASAEQIVFSPREGYIIRINADDIGRAAVLLGAGRERMGEEVDPAVGIILQAKVGDAIALGAGLCALYYTDETHLTEAVQLVEDAFHLSSKPSEPRELVLDLVQ